MENAIISYMNTTYLQLSLLVENFLSVEPSLRHGRKVYSLKPVFHSIISPPLMKEIEKEITLLHLFTTEEICSASPVVENVQLLSDF
jgi:hypothetical protein